MVCKYCGEELPDNANVCEKCDHFTTRGTRKALVGFVLAIVAITLIVAGIWGYKVVKQKRYEEQIIREASQKLNEQLNEDLDNYNTKVDVVLQQMQEETEAIKQQQIEEK